jgi:hypothetical protein
MEKENRKKYIQEFFQDIQEEVIESAVEEEYWDFREESFNKWYEEALVWEGRSGKMKLDADMNGYIFLSYETDDHFSGFPDEFEEAVDSLESRMKNQNSDLPEISGISYRKHIAFDVGKDLEDYGEGIQRYLRDFVHLAEHTDKKN